MFSEGYRPTAAGGHAAVVEFLGICLDASLGDSADDGPDGRQRPRITYDAPGTVSPSAVRVKNSLDSVAG
jgi:hypothetical protein